jgi:hypothetical protein
MRMASLHSAIHAYMYAFHPGMYPRSLVRSPVFHPSPVHSKVGAETNPRPEFIPTLGPRYAPNRDAHSVRPPIEFRFHPVFRYIIVRVIKPMSRFFQQRATEPFHSGKLLSSRSSAPFSLFVNEHERRVVQVPEEDPSRKFMRILASASEANSPKRFAGAPNQLGMCFNSMETSETTQASPSLIHDMYPQMIATAWWSWGRGLAD